MQDDSTDPLIGSTLDERYLVVSRVAQGGMSTVYLAKDLRLGRNIALKILPQHLAADTAFITRLRREAQSAASLSHPHVVQIHDHAVGPRHAYLVFEFIDGCTLRDVMNANGALTPRQALSLLDPIVEGLAAAHSAGLVHRDVKPENVLINRKGWVKIGDFGLSRAVTTNTNTGNPMGTVAYLAPELALGKGGDARSDIYSAGIMLYELLTGLQPFRSALSVAVVMSHIQEDVPAPSLAVPALPAVMDELVRYMTEKDPDRRPANGSVLLEDLRHIRNSLSDAELDLGRPATATVIPDKGLEVAAPTESVAPPSNLLQRSAEATTTVPPAHFPTSVLSPAELASVPAQTRTFGPLDPDAHDAGRSGTAVVDTAAWAAEPNEAPEKPLSKRQAAVQARIRAKEAATPRQSLGPRKPRRRALLWILLILFLGLLAAGAGWYVGFGPAALATVPDVHNKSIAQAQELLQAAGFEQLPTSDVFDEQVAAGLIVATDPAAGSSVRKFNNITLHVSRGPVLYAVPTLTGITLDQATKALTGVSLAAGTVDEAFDGKVPAGVVVSQDPAPGKEFRAGTKVNMVVSKGPKPVPVPNVAGSSEADAVAAIKAAGLNPAVAPDQVNSTTVPAGSVISQTPENGELKPGETVTLTISKGPRMIPVPNMVGKQVSAATTELKALGFDVQVENILGGFFGTVRVQTPDSGSAPEGSTIVLKVV